MSAKLYASLHEGCLSGAGDPSDHQSGAFVQHVKARIGINMKTSDHMSFEDTATLGVGITTVGQGWFRSPTCDCLLEE